MVLNNQRSNIFTNKSAKSIGLFFYIVIQDAHICAETLAKDLKEGESAISTGLKELRELGFLELKTTRNSDGTFTKATSVTRKGYDFFVEVFGNMGTFNSHFPQLFYGNHTRSGNGFRKFIPRLNGESYPVIDSQGFEAPSPSELAKMRAVQTQEEEEAELKKLEQARLEFEAQEKKKHRAQFKARSLKPNKEAWSATDISFEFADRVKLHWNIEPWTVTQTRFRYILASKRRRFNTNGRIEFIMMDRFFESEEMSQFTDANHLMGRFFRRFGELKTYVESRGLLISEDEKQAQFEAEKTKSQRSRRKFFESSDSLPDPRVQENQRNYDYFKLQRELDFQVGMLTEAELAAVLLELDHQYQPR